MENPFSSKPRVKRLLAVSCIVFACLGLLSMGSHTSIAGGEFRAVDTKTNEFTLLSDLPGDVNGDCAVDIADIMLVASRWGCECGNECYDPRYDLDEDCDIDIADIMLVARHWGDACPTPTPTISNLTTNLADYPNGQVPRYEKFEVTFEVNTVAENLQLPYDPSPPPGLEPGTGITVNALFTPDDWQTVYTQPAFYYQEFEDEIRRNKEWFYPTGNSYWKVRFAPNQEEKWQYKLTAQDASGSTETQPQSFIVVPSDNKGFIRVSSDDPRYFAFEDGTYFPALGYNMNAQNIDWVNPVLSNEEHLQKMGQNGVQLVRLWLSQWGIFTSAWNPWNAIEPDKHAQYIPRTGMSTNQAYPGSEVSMQIKWNSNWYSTCMFIGGWKAKPAVKRNTDYRVRVRYKTFNITGPRIAGYPYGFVAKTGGWLWGEYPEGVFHFCYDPADENHGTPVTPYQSENTTDWQILEGTIQIGDGNQDDFLPYFYLALENVNSGEVYTDYVGIEEDLGNGQYGPNIVSKPWMAHHQYFEQRNSYAFDKLVELAKQYGVYLRPVILEKNEWILNGIDYEGNFTSPHPNDYFYGNWRQITKVRWLQQAWWRYLQARWGYSTNIHSWELLNEGDPWNGLHYTLADEFGKYMHCRVFGVDIGGWGEKCTYDHPNDHLVSTSNWHSFPKDNFWAHPDYPDVDFADYHRYVPADTDPNFYDTAQATYEVSMNYGAKQPGGAGKPVVRGEIGFTDSGGQPATDQLLADNQGVWLHNFIWGSINPGGLIESYWYENKHIYSRNRDGTYDFDHRHQYGNYYNFIKDIPLNNGHYQDAGATVSDDNLRAWGQKDLVNGNAHLWIQNKNHTWKNVVDGISIPEVSGEVTITGFVPNKQCTLECWDTYTGAVSRTETVTTDGDGNVHLQISNLQDDLAVKILNPN